MEQVLITIIGIGLELWLFVFACLVVIRLFEMLFSWFFPKGEDE